jgi:hypothetical protein
VGGGGNRTLAWVTVFVLFIYLFIYLFIHSFIYLFIFETGRRKHQIGGAKGVGMKGEV